MIAWIHTLVQFESNSASNLKYKQMVTNLVCFRFVCDRSETQIVILLL